MEGRKILTRTILIVSFISLFTDIASEMLYPVMPVYLAQNRFFGCTDRHSRRHG